ncbi:hypothetical protein P9Z39_29255 [Bacillus thuringiensis]|uniref:hypothetical protein n=1 Tax=Bacillus thuringiensis TaxID=1428 RepID=UPI002DB57E36|nr:hypothetical protein [Bacillus thuringiensis]MEC2709699.1 hypothetical protein [Bacillus thuringiensis]
MANINIDKELWSQVHEDDKKLIEELLRETKSLDKDDTITPVDMTSESEEKPENFWCKAKCEGAFVAASAGCAGFTGPAFAACMAVAAVARNSCLKDC